MDKTIVETSYGKLRGSVESSIENYDYYAFKGIPYAKPPVGDLRFEEPQLPNSWEGIRDARDYGDSCAQYDQFTRLYLGSDDCLYLNVYAKNLKPSTLLPVMMWIHGGAYTFGCGDDMFYGPDYLLRKDILLVTINYRVGVLGFLNLEDEAAPGNQGLKDLVLALKWIKSEIAKFGGDPDNVTIFGESSGGASVTYLALSSMAKGLFHKAISQSGCALNTWASVPNPKSYGYKLCKLLGKETSDPREAVEFLRKIDPLSLAKMQEKMRTPEERLQLLYPFGPGTDDKARNPFMPKNVLTVGENGLNVPYLAGYNNREGIYSIIPIQKHDLQDANDNFARYLHPHLIQVLNRHDLTVENLRDMYDLQELKKDTYAEKVADFFGDMYVVEGFHKMITHNVLKSSTPIYYYVFTYDKGVSFTKLIIKKDLSGASHFDEIPHLFTMKFGQLLGVKPFEKGTRSYELMEEMTEMWTNFAKTGKPTPDDSKLISEKWLPVSNPTMFRYMEIGDTLRMKSITNIHQTLAFAKSFKNKL